MMERYLGKIYAVKYGLDTDGRFGLTVELAFDGHGCNDWSGLMNMTTSAVGSLAIEHTQYVWKLLKAAKCLDVHELKGKPVEVFIQGGLLKSWRILEEVL